MDDEDYDEEEEEDFIYNILVNYLYIHLVIQGVTMIQRQFRRYVAVQRENRLIHAHLSFAHKYDIVEYSYSPPDRKSPIPLLWNGGFHYRESKRSFNSLKNI